MYNCYFALTKILKMVVTWLQLSQRVGRKDVKAPDIQPLSRLHNQSSFSLYCKPTHYYTQWLLVVKNYNCPLQLSQLWWVGGVLHGEVRCFSRFTLGSLSGWRCISSLVLANAAQLSLSHSHPQLCCYSRTDKTACPFALSSRDGGSSWASLLSWVPHNPVISQNFQPTLSYL